MSRTTADRACGQCGWEGHIVEDAQYTCPNCGESLIARPVTLDESGKVVRPPRMVSPSIPRSRRQS